MFYKVLKDGKVIDILTQLNFVKYQPKHDIMLVCQEREAQGIISSNSKYIWHWSDLPKIPKAGYDTVDVVEIDQYEYEQLKAFNMKTPEEMYDEILLSLLQEGFV